MKAAEYWKRRTVDLEHLLQARTTATMVEVNRMYAQGVEQINAQIERILRRYVKNGQISQAYVTAVYRPHLPISGAAKTIPIVCGRTTPPFASACSARSRWVV